MEDLRIAERQLERLENQNRVFDSESLSDDTSDEETKKAEKSGVSHASSLDDSASDANNRGSMTSGNNRSRMSEGGTNNTRANTTAKSNDSVTDSSNYKALQESLDSFGAGDGDSIKARSDVL